VKRLNFEETAAFHALLESPAIRHLVSWVEDSIEADRDRLETHKLTDMREVGFLQGRISWAREFAIRLKDTREKARAFLDKEQSGREKGPEKEGAKK